MNAVMVLIAMRVLLLDSRRLAGGKTNGRAAIVTTLRNAGAGLDSFVAYHLAVGFEHIYLFFDDPADPDLPRVAANPRVSAIPCDTALRRAWMSLPGYSDQADFVDVEVMARQLLNVELAMTLARERGLGWLLHIDADELFYPNAESAAQHFAWLEGTGFFDTMTYRNHEAVPERDDIGDFFREVDLFKVPADLRSEPITDEGRKLLQETPQLQPRFFHFYNNGKSAVRLSAPDMQPKDVHAFFRPNGEHAGAQHTQHFILHYACCGFENFWMKYATLGRFSDQWWKKYDIGTLIGPVHLQARDVVASGDREAARDFYRQRIAIEDRPRIDALLACGLLARFPQPRRILEAAGRAGGKLR
jgi:hypothetical protein